MIEIQACREFLNSIERACMHNNKTLYRKNKEERQKNSELSQDEARSFYTLILEPLLNDRQIKITEHKGFFGSSSYTITLSKYCTEGNQLREIITRGLKSLHSPYYEQPTDIRGVPSPRVRRHTGTEAITRYSDFDGDMITFGAQGSFSEILSRHSNKAKKQKTLH